MKIIILSLAVLLYGASPVLGHDVTITQRKEIAFDPGATYEIRYTPIGTDKMAIIRLSGIGEVRMIGMREFISGITPEGKTYHLPVDLILDIHEVDGKKPVVVETPDQKKK